MTADKDFILNFKAHQAGLNIKELTGDDSEIYKAYSQAGGLCAQTPTDTHYIIDGAYIIFIGSKDEMLGLLNANF